MTATRCDDWQPIETAPKDGSRILFRNVENGLYDVGHWADYSHYTDDMKAHWPTWMEGETGEWCTDLGNGDMTHWMTDILK